MRVTAFCGSPRKDGNTAAVLERMLRGAGCAGAEVRLRRLNDMKIAPCQACGWCKEHPDGFCVNQDDMQTIYRDIRDSDVLIIGSPVYMWQMTAQTKCMVDRLYGTLLPGFESKTGPRRMVLVFTHGAPEGTFDGYVQSTAGMFGMLGFKVEAILAMGDSGTSGGGTKMDEILDRAEETGRSLVR